MIAAMASSMPIGADRRPISIAYVRSGSSSFWAIGDVDAGTTPVFLQQDLDTGAWQRRYNALLDLDAYDAGFRLVVTD